MNLFGRRSKNAADRLLELLLENLPRSVRHRQDDLRPATALRELGVDSLGLILVITRFCEEFDIRMETLEGNIGDLRTVGDLLIAGERIIELRNESVSNG
jgi:acyl carrier protein